MILFKDISYAQGAYDMGSNPDPAVMMKMSGAYTVSKSLYYDSQAARNYNNAVAAGKVPLMYHFAGGGDPVAEADWFVKAVSPLAENDVLALDWEIENSDPVGWVTAFVNEVFNRTSVWPWVYMDIDRLNSFDWSGILDKCGLWCAAPSFSFDAQLPVKYTVIAQQGPIENGVDTDAFFGDVDQLKKYGYHVAPVTTPQPPVPAPDPTPVPPTPAPVPDPAPVPENPPQPTPPPVVHTPTGGVGFFAALWNWVKALFGIK